MEKKHLALITQKLRWILKITELFKKKYEKLLPD